MLTALLSGCAKPYVFPAESSRMAPQLLDVKAVMNDTYLLPVRHWGNPLKSKAIILAIHGLNDYSYGFESTGKYLADRNILVFSYDQRGFGATKGHGFWHGSQRMISDNRAIIRLLREKYPDKSLFLLGESMGGAVLLASIAEFNEGENGIDGTILIAPAIWSRQTMPWYQRTLLWLAAHTVPAKKLTGEGLDLIPSDNIEMLRAMGRDPLVIKATRVDVLYGVTNLMDLAADSTSGLTQKSLILYGEHDQIVPGKPICRWLNTLPQAMQRNTIFYENGYHMLNRDLQAQRVLDDIISWIELASIKNQDDEIDITSLAGKPGSLKSITDFCKDKGHL
ncbi:MAG: alpha/beta fold hydrolase [Arenicellales bacterium]